MSRNLRVQLCVCARFNGTHLRAKALPHSLGPGECFDIIHIVFEMKIKPLIYIRVIKKQRVLFF